MVKKLRTILQSIEDNVRMLKENTFFSQLAAKTKLKGLYYYFLRLTMEYLIMSTKELKFEHEKTRRS